MNKRSTVAVLYLAALLTGCDSEPSSSEIQKAMQENIEHTNQQARQRLGENSKDMLTTLNKAEKVSCKESEAKGTYLCKVDTDITLPYMGEKMTVAEFKFVKINNYWKIKP
jgi:aspartate/methionine/tyrosine aminotransferase